MINLEDYGLEKVLKLGIGNTLKSRIVLDVVHAMKYIHEIGMMHRNLKVENIMLNSLSMTKLVDFGLVRIEEMAFDGFSFDKETLSLTKGLGTFAYMSPEMAREENYNFKTDVYSFGIVLYCIFTGKLPEFSLKDKMNGEMPEMPKPSFAISQFCIDLISRCLDKLPSERPSFDEILNSMRENEFKFASDVDFDILSKRDKEIEFIENKLAKSPKTLGLLKNLSFSLK